MLDRPLAQSLGGGSGIEMNQWPEAGRGQMPPSDRFWVLAEARRLAGVDQLTPFLSKGVNGGFSQNLPLTLREHDVRLRDPPPAIPLLRERRLTCHVEKHLFVAQW